MICVCSLFYMSKYLCDMHAQACVSVRSVALRCCGGLTLAIVSSVMLDRLFFLLPFLFKSLITFY